MSQYLYDRHIGLSEHEREQMLAEIGVNSIDELLSQTIPNDIRTETMNLEDAVTENQHLADMHFLASRNKLWKTYIGRGNYSTATPSVILRNVFQNPVWYTSYTPYQAEVSQGRLEALFLFQTVISDMTGMPLANCSLLDEATAAAESVTMMRNLRSREQVKANVRKVLVDEKIFDETLAVLRTRAQGQGIELVVKPYSLFFSEEHKDDYFGAVIQYPNADGSVEDYADFVEMAHQNGLKVTVISDLLSLALLPSPASFGADIVCGSAQRFGLPMGFGGPTAGFMATRDEYKRDMPGRIIGLSKDVNGKPAFRLALQTREQHIKREKATSNICTAEALSAMMAGLYAVWHGANGIRQIAEAVHSKATYLNEMLQAYGYEQLNALFFDTLKIVLPQGVTQDDIRKEANEREINLFYAQDGTVSLSVNETTDADDMNDLIDLFATACNNMPQYEDDANAFEGLSMFDEAQLRQVDYLQADVFNKYHTETELMRYLKRLERKDISLTHSMIPLGSCTMKLNPASAMLPITDAGFTQIHPLVPHEQAEGYIEIMDELKQQLCAITGFAACTLQPTSGAAGEYAGLVTIRKALSGTNRTVLLIPQSAHGTNPASCVQAGFTPLIVKCDELGNTDLNDWEEKATANKDILAGCMITYPSTHGIFEKGIRRMCQIVHNNGGLVYMDGANMNAQIGYTNPAFIGADVCHLNLHKSFAAPHGGGGPGAGAVLATENLAQFLPAEKENRVSSSFYGNADIALISYGYIRMMGADGLRSATANAILAANYLAKQLEGAYSIVYKGEQGRVGHELILDCRQFKDAGITETDIAKRLMDYGYHAPTLSFPVHGTLMIEPTESESKDELDRFVEVMLSIRKEIEEIRNGQADKTDNVLLNAPHAEYEVTNDDWHHSYSRQKAAYPLPYLQENKFWLPVKRVDNGFGDRNLIARL